MNQDYGYLHYETTIAEPVKGKLAINELRDYAVVILNGKVVGSAISNPPTTMSLSPLR